MADDVSVSFGAQIAGLLGGINQATSAIKGFAQQSIAPIEGLAGTFSRLQNAIIAVASGYAFKEIIEGAVGTTLEVAKLSKAFGISKEEASYVRVELLSLGISTEDYREAATRLDRQVRQNEASLREYGLQTRDSNGRLKDQSSLLQEAIRWTLQYKEGTDRTIAAQTAFGRGSGDTIIALGKLSAETRAAAIETARSLGLITTADDISRARAYKEAMAQVSLTFEGIRKAIADAVLPYLTRFAQWFREQGPNVIEGMKQTTQVVVGWMLDVVQGLGNLVFSLIEQIGGLSEALDKLKGKIASFAGGALAGGVAGAVVGGPLGALLGVFAGGTVGAVADGILTGAQSVEESNKRLAEQRDKFNEIMKSLRDTLMNGGPTTKPAFAGPGPGGEKDASSIIKDRDGGKAALKEIDGELAILRAGYERKRLLVQADRDNFNITEDQKFAKLQQIEQEEYQSELQLLQRKRNIRGLDKTQRQQVDNEINALYQKHLTDQLKLDQQSIAARRQLYIDFANTLKSSWDGQLRGLLTGQTTWAQAFKNILLDMTVQFIQYSEKQVVEWAAAQLAKTTASQTGAAAEAAAAVAGQEATLPTRIAAFTSTITADAAQAFAGIFAFLSPFMGPAAAGPAAAGAATVEAQLAAVPKFETGAWNIPHTMAAILHPGEVVLPAQAGQAFRDFATNGGQVGGDVHHWHISAIDPKSGAEFLRRNGPAIVKSITGERRNGNRSLRPK